MVDGAEVKLFGSSVVDLDAVNPLGTVLSATSALHVACGSGTVAIREVQPAGRKRQPVSDWVRGRGIAVGACFA